MNGTKSKLRPSIKTQKPVPVLFKPVKADFKDLFKALAKGIGHAATGKWIELGADAVEAFSSLGLTTEPGELAFLLVQRSLTLALFELLGDSAAQFPDLTTADATRVVDRLDFTIEANEFPIDQRFLDRPTELTAIEAVQKMLLAWLKGLGIAEPSAQAVTNRLPAYFVYALNQEWRRNSKSYSPLLDALNTPFTKAGEREWAWAEYGALIQRRIQEPVFEEPFSLSQVFVPLNAYYRQETSRIELDTSAMDRERQKLFAVTRLQKELENWLDSRDPQDAIRVISGGPGSGKSSFARVFAAKLAETHPKTRVLFVPLHLIDAANDLVDEVGRFVRDEGILTNNPLDPESAEPSLLVIFDGLDELASQGKAAAETAKAFVREVEKTVERRNQQALRLRVLLSGRELVIQENESEFRRPRQVLNLLPYFTPVSAEYKGDVVSYDGSEYEDSAKLLLSDLREQWWKNYGSLTGRGFAGLPEELKRQDLDEITAQPLLNYLIALSFTRGTLDFTKDINLNSIYADLVAAVHERGYEKRRVYRPIREMKLDNFFRVLEEVGLAAWHGDGRTTTVSEIEEHCKVSGLSGMLEAFQEGAKAGVTRLLAAFFFRQYGQRVTGDPTFIFTHKSFGEYLAARRVVRAIERVARELDRRANSPDEGWDEKEALKHWAQICGPSPMTDYLRQFLFNEVRLRSREQIEAWQEWFQQLFDFMLRHAMPMEQLPIPTFKQAMFQSRNAEEALLVALNVCGETIERITVINPPENTTFGSWLKRIFGQLGGDHGQLARRSLSFLNLHGMHLALCDLFQTTAVNSTFERAMLLFSSLRSADFTRVDLRGADLYGSDLTHSNFSEANLEDARLSESGAMFARFAGANLAKAYLYRADLRYTDFQGAELSRGDLSHADLEAANLLEANLSAANLTGANFSGAILTGANLTGADLTGANLIRANLQRTNLSGANLTDTNFEQAILDDVVTSQIANFESGQSRAPFSTSSDSAEADVTG